MNAVPFSFKQMKKILLYANKIYGLEPDMKNRPWDLL